MKKLFRFLLVFVFIVYSLLSLEANAFANQYKVMKDKDGVYVVEIYGNKVKDRLVPYVVQDLETNDAVYRTTGAKFCVNAGFFDPKNKKTVSYVVIDGQLVANPEENENLTGNKSLAAYMQNILNRSEFRILEDEKGKILYDIASHKEAIKDGYKLKHSIQAGPMLTPELRLEEEFFVLKKDGKIISESASSLHKFARTAIGIKNNNVYLFIVTKDAPMTLDEVADLARRWGMEKAMAFDGGGSTSFESPELYVISEKDDTARKLKSFLILK